MRRYALLLLALALMCACTERRETKACVLVESVVPDVLLESRAVAIEDMPFDAFVEYINKQGLSVTSVEIESVNPIPHPMTLVASETCWYDVLTLASIRYNKVLTIRKTGQIEARDVDLPASPPPPSK